VSIEIGQNKPAGIETPQMPIVSTRIPDNLSARLHHVTRTFETWSNAEEGPLASNVIVALFVLVKKAITAVIGHAHWQVKYFPMVCLLPWALLVW